MTLKIEDRLELLEEQQQHNNLLIKDLIRRRGVRTWDAQHAPTVSLHSSHRGDRASAGWVTVQIGDEVTSVPYGVSGSGGRTELEAAESGLNEILSRGRWHRD